MSAALHSFEGIAETVKHLRETEAELLKLEIALTKNTLERRQIIDATECLERRRAKFQRRLADAERPTKRTHFLHWLKPATTPCP